MSPSFYTVEIFYTIQHKLGLYGKAKHSDVIHREGMFTGVPLSVILECLTGKALEHTPLHRDGSTDTSSEAFEERRNMKCSPTFINDQVISLTGDIV